MNGANTMSDERRKELRKQFHERAVKFIADDIQRRMIRSLEYDHRQAVEALDKKLYNDISTAGREAIDIARRRLRDFTNDDWDSLAMKMAERRTKVFPPE